MMIMFGKKIPIPNFKAQLKPSFALFTILCLFILSTGQAHPIGLPGTGIGAPFSRIAKDLIRNISDGEIFKKSSIARTIKADKDTLKLEPESFLSDLSKDSPSYGFELIKKELNKTLSVHHYRQMYKNLSVFGGEIIVRISEKEGTVILTGYFFEDIQVNVEPVYNAFVLTNTAKKVLNGGETEGDAQLGILPADDGYHLCYKIRVIKGIAEDYIFYMDAFTGGVLRAFNQVDAMRQ